jgi:RNA polymerase sigma-70 factor (ECF subfamily)
VALRVDHLFRHRSGQMVATLTRVLGFANIDLVEDVVQDALVQALRHWPLSGVPANPTAWLIQVAKNRALDALRRRGTWRSKEEQIESELREAERRASGPRSGFADELQDDQLRMIFACCHPALRRDAQVALTLKTVGGFSVPELGRAFLVQTSTMAQRLLRAKQRLRLAGTELEIPAPAQLPSRLDAVFEVVYLMFNEGYSPGEGETAVRLDLCSEAIRLAEILGEHPLTGTPKACALAALLLFQGSRLQARADPAGELLLLPEQDRGLWDRGLIARGVRWLGLAARGEELSEYHLQAEIAACHATAASAGATDWPRILACYDGLLRLNPSPVVALNRAVALARVEGPEAGLAALEALDGYRELRSYYPAHATRGELLARLGRREAARASFRRALELTSSAPVRRLCERRCAELAG